MNEGNKGRGSALEHGPKGPEHKREWSEEEVARCLYLIANRAQHLVQDLALRAKAGEQLTYRDILQVSLDVLHAVWDGTSRLGIGKDVTRMVVEMEGRETVKQGDEP